MRWLLISLVAVGCWAQTPTLVQSFWTENSTGLDGTWTGACANGTTLSLCGQFGEVTLSGNLLVCEAFGANTGSPTYSIKDDQSGTWSLASGNYPFTSASGNIYNLWYQVNNPGGIRRVTVAGSNTNGGFVDLKCGEFYNVATSSPVNGTANCHTVTSTTATGVATGTLTSGDLVLLFSDNDNVTAIASFTAGSQTSITWVLAGVDRLDGYAFQYGVYSATASFTPQMTTGTSQPFTSCQVAFKAASAGTAPTQTPRIVHLGHYAIPASTTTRTFQFPSTGTTTIVSFTGGGDCIANSGNTGCGTAASAGVTSTPSNTWAMTGNVAGSTALTASSQIAYACNASTAPTETIAITRNVNGGALAQDTALMYDIVGLATACFDNDSGGQSGTGSSLVTSFTTCSSCLTPGTASGLVIMNGNWNFGTATTLTAPSGSVFDSAVTSFNAVNGPEPVDQNGGWAHLYNVNTNALTVTWTMANDGTNAPGGWAGRAAHFLAPSGVVENMGWFSGNKEIVDIIKIGLGIQIGLWLFSIRGKAQALLLREILKVKKRATPATKEARAAVLRSLPNAIQQKRLTSYVRSLSRKKP